jgi:hypothetical protein
MQLLHPIRAGLRGAAHEIKKQAGAQEEIGKGASNRGQNQEGFQVEIHKPSLEKSNRAMGNNMPPAGSAHWLWRE